MIFTLSGLNGVALGKYATPEMLGPADVLKTLNALKEAHKRSEMEWREFCTFNGFTPRLPHTVQGDYTLNPRKPNGCIKCVWTDF